MPCLSWHNVPLLRPRVVIPWSWKPPQDIGPFAPVLDRAMRIEVKAGHPRRTGVALLAGRPREEARLRSFWLFAQTLNSSRSSSLCTTRLRHSRRRSPGCGNLDRSFPFTTVVTIADNASIDGTDALARALAARLDGVQVWLTRHGARRDLGRAGFVLWGGWMLLTAAIFSETKGIFNAYSTVALAPAVAASAGAGAVALWRLGRERRWLAPALPVAIVGSALWAAALLDRTRDYAPGLAKAILIAAGVAALGILVALLVRPKARAVRWLGAGAAAIASLALLAGPLAYSVSSIERGTSGPLALAGPSVAGGGIDLGIPGLSISLASIQHHGRAKSPPSALVRYLQEHRDGAHYLLAVSGSLTAAPYIISTWQPVMAMGGYTGMDPWPALSAFEKMVSQDKEL